MFRLAIDPNSAFATDHSMLVNQYRQIENNSKLETVPAIKKHFYAMIDSLFAKAVTKVDDHYLYPDFLKANLDVFKRKYTPRGFALPAEIIATRNDLRLLNEFEEYLNGIKESLFPAIANGTITEKLLHLSGVDLNEFFAPRHIEGMAVYKFDGLLHAATRNGNIEAIAILLRLGANVNQYKPSYHYKDRWSRTINTTPLGVAIESDNINAARFLLEQGATIDMFSFSSKVNKQPITENIKSQEMTALLNAFFQAECDRSPGLVPSIGSFFNQFLYHANASLKAEVNEMGKRLAAIEALVVPRQEAILGHPAVFFAPPAVAEVSSSGAKRHKVNPSGESMTLD